MTISQKIDAALSLKNISQAELARKIGMTRQNFNKKFKRETFTLDELKLIAEALGAEYFFGFEFEDGTTI